MSTTVQDPEAPGPSTPSSASDDRLDQLMPRPAPMWRRAFGGGLLLCAVGAVSFLYASGYLVPHPFGSQNFSGGASWHLATDDRLPAEQDTNDGATALVRRTFRNFGNRSVRLTSIVVDAPGMEVARIEARVHPPPDLSNCHTTTSGSSGTTVCEISEADGYDPTLAPADAQVLPLTIEPDAEVDYYLWLRPDDCDNRPTLSYPWGAISASFDFGEGAFPPLARTYPLGELIESEEQTEWLIPYRLSDPQHDIVTELCTIG